MNPKSIIEKLTLGEKAKDYGYLIVFFLTFAFFTLVVIRPNITTVFNLNKELENLRLVNDSYNSVIDKIIYIQSALEITRDKIYVVEEALPSTPQVYKIIDDLKKTSSQNQLIIDKLAISDINLKTERRTDNFESIEINFRTSARFEDLNRFVQTVVNQRRLKNFKNLVFTLSPKESSDSAKVETQFLIEGYYL